MENLIKLAREGRLERGLGLTFGTTHRPNQAERVLYDIETLTQKYQVGRKSDGSPYRFKILTYGCQMNEHDTEVMAGLLHGMGYAATESEEDADFILFNTCAVRENAEDKVFGQIGRMRPLKYRNPELLFGLCGCMAQEKGVQQFVLDKFPWVDLVFGTHNIQRLPELLFAAKASTETVLEVWEKAPETVEDWPKIRKDNVRAWVNIQYGCNKFCTYCIVPYTRGVERSRLPEDIYTEIKALVEEGYRDITLLGQNVNDYGVDLGTANFAQLLREVNGIPGVDRVRFTTSNPWNFTDDLIDAIATCEHVVEHIHLPVQSGSDRILKRMNRSHTRAYYLQLVDKIRRKIPDVVLTTDIIVGFPGETEEDFVETLHLIQEVEFDSAFTFIYSPRENTPAADFEDTATHAEKKSRLKRLNDAQNEISLRRNLRLRGNVVDVIVEGESRTNAEVLSGRTRGNRLVLFPGSLTMKGRHVQVEITDPQTFLLKGRMVEAHEVIS